MATKLELKPKDDECEFGTLQENMEKSKKTYESYDFGSHEGSIKIQISFLKKIAVVAASNASFSNNENILHPYAKFVSFDVFQEVIRNNYFAARDLIAAEISNKKFETYSKHLFAYYYITTLLNTRDLNSCLTLDEYGLLYV
jgi:hypothetical protein